LQEELRVSDVKNPVSIRDVSWMKQKMIPVNGVQPKIFVEDGQNTYLLKFSITRLSRRPIPHHISEYISCKVIKSLGYAVQDVELVSYEGKIGVLINLFSQQFITFIGLGDGTLSGSNLGYDLDSLYQMLGTDKFSNECEIYLWDTFILDAFVNNLDRHPNNWGFFSVSDGYVLAPLIDLGHSLFSLNAYNVARMQNIDNYMFRYGNSSINCQGNESRRFRDIIKNENNPIFLERLKIFKGRLNLLDLSAIDLVHIVEPFLTEYCDFLRRYFNNQIAWFNKLE